MLPVTNTEFWSSKITNSRERDLRDYAFLESLDWRWIVVWECELAAAALPNTVGRVCKGLIENRKSWQEEMANRRRRREQWRFEKNVPKDCHD